MIKKLNCTGLSFIELLLTLSILGVLVIAIFSLIVNIAAINMKSEQQYNATLLAQSYMENIKASEDIKAGKVIYNDGDFEIIIDIIEINEYRDEIYKVIVEVVGKGKSIEKLESYKILDY